jgi:FSR family fosmidomycin resistance protein-like MFS transporter
MSLKITPRLQLLALTVAHGAVDAYALVVPFLLPILLADLAPANQRELYAGIFAAVVAVASSLGQTGFALISDRTRNPVFLWGGLATAAVGMSLIGLSPNLPTAFALVLAGGFGVAAFHPQATVAARRVSRNEGFGVSFFVTGGNLGQAIGPFLLIFALARFGRWAFAPAMLAGLALAFLLIPMLTCIINGGTTTVAEDRARSPIPYRPLSALFALVVVRTLAYTGFLNFMSLYLSDMGLSDVARAGVMSGFIFFGSVGILVGGALSDRWLRLPLIVGSALIPAPLWVAALHTHGFGFFALLFVGNLIYQSSTSVFIVLGQETMPERSNLATSLMMGAAWGTAGLLALPVGAIANIVGLSPTLTGLAAIPVLATPLIALLPSHLYRAPRLVDAPPLASNKAIV